MCLNLICLCPQVIMGDRSAAERACKDPNPIIDGRKANVNLAILGAKPRGNVTPGEQPGRLIHSLTHSLSIIHSAIKSSPRRLARSYCRRAKWNGTRACDRKNCWWRESPFDGTTLSFSMWTVRACSRMPAVHYYIFQHPLSLAARSLGLERECEWPRRSCVCVHARPHFPCHRANISMIMPNAAPHKRAHEHTGNRVWPTIALLVVHGCKWIICKDVQTHKIPISHSLFKKDRHSN